MIRIPDIIINIKCYIVEVPVKISEISGVKMNVSTICYIQVHVERCYNVNKKG